MVSELMLLSKYFRKDESTVQDFFIMGVPIRFQVVNIVFCWCKDIIEITKGIFKPIFVELQTIQFFSRAQGTQ